MLLLKRIMVQIRTPALFIILIPLIFSAASIFYLFSTLSAQTTVDAVLQKAEFLIFIIGFLYVAAIIIFLIVINYTLRKHLSSLRNTLDYSKKLASGDFSGKIKITGKDELGELTRTIKYMKDRLQYSVVKLKSSYEREKISRLEAEAANDQKTDFLKKVSEELHSPLTPIISYSNLIVAKINEGKYDKELERKIRVIRAHADNMLNIISNLNELSRLEASEIELNISNFEPSKFIVELINLHHYSATENKVQLKYVFSEKFPGTLHTDREILFHILSNILAYSIHFSPKNAEIIIKFESTADKINFIINDNIAGVLAETITHIFKNSSDRISNMTLHLSNARLFGLISAIANAELLDGTLTADCNHDTGCIFKLILNKNAVTVPAGKQKVPLIHTASNRRKR
jgi:signal transduction histidine kinase